jgi:hypothetical protein
MTQEATETIETTGTTETENLQPITDDGEQTPGDVENTEESATSQPEPKKDGFQERISELTRKNREAIENAEYWRGVAEARAAAQQPQQIQQPAQQGDMKVPLERDFETDEEYTTAMQAYIQSQVSQSKNEVMTTLTIQQKTADRIEKINSLSKDSPEVMQHYNNFNQAPYMTDVMMDAADGETFAEIFNYLGNNRAEASKIVSLDPVNQVKAIMKIERKFTASKPTPKSKSSAPEPTANSGPGYGNPLPKNPQKNTRKENFAAWEKKRLKDLRIET